MRNLILGALAASLVVLCADSCDTRSEPQSASGVSKADVQVPVGSDGLTVEQQNIKDRLVQDNQPGSIKHLYIISAYSGQVLMYSTVRGKVTSGGKRLNPVSVESAGDTRDGFPITIGNYRGTTTEVVQDDGTYGHSMDYLYWWDTKGIYHQQYVTGGMILHISSEPISVKGVVINLSLGAGEE